MRRAFTLIEVLLALGITVIIGAVLAASLWATTKASRSAEAAVEESRQTSTTGDIMEREIANCLPPTGQLAGPFVGTTDDLMFYTTGPEPKAVVQGDIRGIEYTTAPGQGNNNGMCVVRRVQSNLLAQVINTPPDEVICQNVDSLEFWYYDGNEWQDSWDSTQQNNALPIAVRFTLTLATTTRGQTARTTTRIIPFSCYNPQTSTTTGGITP
jgi:general secretion pathway protein J